MSKKKIKSYYILFRDGTRHNFSPNERAALAMTLVELNTEKIEYKSGSLPVSQNQAVRRHLSKMYGDWIRSGKAE